MPLIKYAQYLTYPDGTPAAEASFPVQLRGGNVLIPAFADKAGTTPLSNPVLTDVDGLLTFYAAPGAFYADVAGALFFFVVDSEETDDAWPGTFIHVQAVSASTWTVSHHFGVEPQVEIVVGGEVVEAEVAHTNTGTTVITFGASTAGTAYLRR